MDGALKRALLISSDLRYDSLSEFVHDLNVPNPVYIEADKRPLMEKDPLKFWKLLCGVLVLTEVATLVYFLGGW